MAFTPNRDIIQPTVGGDSGTWGGLLNSGAFAQIDTILGATQPITITVADITLTDSQWNNCAVKLTGVLTGNRNLILPYQIGSASVAVGGLFVVDNQTTGAFNVTVKTVAAGSVGVTVAQGKRAFLYSDNTNVYNADDAKLQLIPYAGNPNGFVAGTASSVNTPPSVVWDYTNAALYFCTTSGVAAAAVWTQSVSPINRGFDTAVNLQLSVTHTGGNLLQLALKTLAGADASVISPITCEFQTVSGGTTTGAVSVVNITTALSMTTNAVGATMGSFNSIPFRVWFALFNNAGTPVLAMSVRSTVTAIYPSGEFGVASTVSVSGTATTAGTWYTPNGTTLSNCAFRIIGYCDYANGLVTAGSYTTDPTAVVVFGPGIKKPGDLVQVITTQSTSPSTITNTGYELFGPNLTITPTSTINPVRIHTVGGMLVSASALAYIQISRGVSLIGFPIGAIPNATNTPSPFALTLYDRPGTTASTPYNFQGKTASGSLTLPAADSGVYLQLEELMG